MRQGYAIKKQVEELIPIQRLNSVNFFCVGVRFIASVWGLWGGRDKSRPYIKYAIQTLNWYKLPSCLKVIYLHNYNAEQLISLFHSFISYAYLCREARQVVSVFALERRDKHFISHPDFAKFYHGSWFLPLPHHFGYSPYHQIPTYYRCFAHKTPVVILC